MKEVKFRSYDGNRMRKAFDLTQNPVFWARDHYDYPLMQYTGLKDKKGVEIYEGDILALGGTEENGHKGPYQIEEVKILDDGSDGLRVKYGRHKNNYHAPYWVEVIGNIYENPELLKAGDEAA